MICNTCEVELTDFNWKPSWRVLNRTQCKDCNNPNRKIKNAERMYVDGKYVSKKHPLYKAGKYTSSQAFGGWEDCEPVTEEGYVYAITNPAWEGWVKIGRAVDANDRCKSYQTASPHRNYRLEHFLYFENRRKAEQQAHKDAERIAEECDSEWFKLSVDEAVKIIDNLKGV